jgi:enoyl reductase-like protein
MKNLSDPTHNQEMIDRLNKLSPTSQAQWGKMNVNQMFTHCQVAINLAFGNEKLKQNIIGILFGSIAKKMMVNSNRPFQKNLPTDKSFIITDKRKFEKERKILISIIQKFPHIGPEGLSKEKHPFFGRLNRNEWETLSWKHLDHHLRQFGA